MRFTMVLGPALAIGLAAFVVYSAPAVSATPGEKASSVGPDVIVGDVTGPSNWNTGTGPTSGIVRYSWGTTSCNIGTASVHWYDFGTADPTEHPVIGQNLFRLKNGRFEQVGQSWLKHGFCALQQSICASCAPFCGGCCDELGVGCSDPYTSQRNGTPTGVGPKSQVNASTGQIITWPYSSPLNTSTTSNDNGQLQVHVADVDPAQNAGATYIAEAQYVAHDDATAGNKNNNASYRRIIFASTTGFPGTYAGPTVRMKTGIDAWKDLDPAVTVVYNDESDGRIIMGYKVTDNGNGTWHYEYAVQNLNSDRSTKSLVIPAPGCVTVTNIGFHDVDYHSGDGVVLGTNYDATDWVPARSTSDVDWSVSTVVPLGNRNALRWGTMYNYRFDANSPPQDVVATMNVYKSSGTISFATKGPQGVASSCAADANHNNVVDIDDLVMVITNWGSAGPNGDVAPPCGNGTINIDDLVAVITSWGVCP